MSKKDEYYYLMEEAIGELVEAASHFFDLEALLNVWKNQHGVLEGDEEFIKTQSHKLREEFGDEIGGTLAHALFETG